MSYTTYEERLENMPTEQEVSLMSFNSDKAAIEKQINTATGQKDFLQAYTAIKDFNRKYEQSYSTLELKKTLLDRVEDMLKKSTAETEKLAAEAQELQTQDFPDSPEELQKLNTQADQKLLELYGQLGTNTTSNKLVIIKAIEQATENNGNRVIAIALLNLMQNPSYRPYFSHMNKEKILASSRSTLWKALDKQRNIRLEAVNKKQAESVMRSFHLRRLFNTIQNSI